ncbi:hypothetical protein [Streptomyces ipomoeae]|uniref:Uncharacterized protein n=1 Tax=Streptomyces ipomoeae 91-03 TaxID=698759 RepID=L1L8H7_9ACTN|nr:hypothetical protein [Streptomyces ipomoeae]EKX69316.1 hypothetical protein STRIP9103_04257 [Streptomyces ipomoeae 91-03]MDX2698648.1 hypothetical protein [Streptomyces ipomoeae]MDX2844293.1 hypothetical protein [Streptomyces ipomoeae]
MSQYGPNGPTPTPPPGTPGAPGTPGPPGPPQPAPPPGNGDHDGRGVRVAVISLIVSSLLTVIGFVVTAATSGKPETNGGTSGGQSPINDTGGRTVPSDDPTSPSPESPEVSDTGPDSDGLTAADRALRDSLNDSQWQRDSCAHHDVPDTKAALRCTVSAQDATGFEYAATVVIMEYPSQKELRAAYLKYAANLPAGNCDIVQGVQGRWTDGRSSKPVGDTACFTNNTGMYDIIRTFYERPVAFEVVDSDPVALTNWVNTLEPVFTD